MPSMTNPMDALNKLQDALDGEVVQLEKGNLYPELGVIMDQPTADTRRLTFANVQGGRVLAIAMFVIVQPVRGVACYHLGYAVIEPLWNQGLGTDIVKKAMAELLALLKGNGAWQFYIEAVVGIENDSSNKLARRLISNGPQSIRDLVSGQPALHYLTLIKA
jgi:hypothetical protein